MGKLISRIYTSTGWKAQLLCLKILKSDLRDRSPPLGDARSGRFASLKLEPRPVPRQFLLMQ